MAMLDALSEMERRQQQVREIVVRRWSAASIVVSESVDDEEAARLANIAPVDVTVSVIRVAQGAQASPQD